MMNDTCFPNRMYCNSTKATLSFFPSGTLPFLWSGMTHPRTTLWESFLNPYHRPTAVVEKAPNPVYEDIKRGRYESLILPGQGDKYYKSGVCFLLSALIFHDLLRRVCSFFSCRHWNTWQVTMTLRGRQKLQLWSICLELRWSSCSSHEGVES